jgi:hypothetical protein
MRPPYLTYRPLRPGIAIINRDVDQYGTVGFFGQSNDGGVWLVSCYHVLGRVDFGAYVAGEGIFQPDYATAAEPVAELVVGRSDVGLDCAAARVLPGVVAVNELLGVGPISPAPVAPVVGMRVFKYGVATELTEGVVADVQGSDITIAPVPGFPREYQLSDIGDSGALWLEQGTLRPVALHKQGAAGGTEKAVGSSVGDVLALLGLKMLGA